MTYKSSTIMLLPFFLVGCTSPFIGGPGRITVSLDKASIVNTTRGALSEHAPQKLLNNPIKVVRFDISSKKNLHKYFTHDWDRILQVRCNVEGAKRSGPFHTHAYGPIYKNKDIKLSNAINHHIKVKYPPIEEPGIFKYTILTFTGLKAGYTGYFGGEPVTALDLTSEVFDRLECFLIGVTKAPVMFPRSNSFGINEKHFRELQIESWLE